MRRITNLQTGRETTQLARAAGSGLLANTITGWQQWSALPSNLCSFSGRSAIVLSGDDSFCGTASERFQNLSALLRVAKGGIYFHPTD